MMFDTLIASATKSLDRSGFHLLDDGVERSGAIEWAWIKSDGLRHFYVGLATLSVKPGSYWIEVWTGADDGVHHTGRLSVWEYNDASAQQIEQELEKDIIGSLHSAAKKAENATKEDMSYDYPSASAFTNSDATV